MFASEIIPLDTVHDFEQNLMNKLDSDIMKMVDPVSHYVIQHMDIRAPLFKLRRLIELKLNMSLSNYTFTLQDSQIVCGLWGFWAVTNCMVSRSWKTTRTWWISACKAKA